MPWISALASAARSGLQVDPLFNRPMAALRGTVGVAIVVGAALGLGSPRLAASATMGAFITGSATLQQSFRPRPLLALVAALGLGVSTFVGYVASVHTVLYVLVVGLWAFGAGMAWSMGQVSGVVAAQTLSAMLIVVTLPVSVPTAAEHALVICAAGLVQTALAVVWPVRAWGSQRDALADACASVADYARRLREDPLAPFDPAELMHARLASTVTPGQARHRPAELAGMRGPVERIRPVLAALADPRVGAPEFGPQRDRARALLGAAARVLDAIASAVRHGGPVLVPDQALAVLAPLDQGESEEEAEVEDEEEGEPLRGAARRAEQRLVRLLAEAVDAVDAPVEALSSTSTDVPTSGQPRLRRASGYGVLPVAWQLIRRQCRWESPVFRHALRVGVVAALGDGLGRALQLEHGYWAPLTAVMVMRPDFAQTYSRGFARLVGTVGGVLVATAITVTARPGPWICAGLVVVALGTMYLTMRTGYVAASTCISAYVVFLLAMAGSQALQTGEQRVLMTLLGGGLAFAAYAVFPTWETSRLADRLADFVRTSGEYTAAALGAYGDPGGAGRSRAVRDALLDSREARAALARGVERARAEPVRARGVKVAQVARARAALVAMGRGTMLLEAHLPARDAPAVPGALDFAESLREGTARAAAAIRVGRPVGDAVAGVRDAYRRWRRDFLPRDSAGELRGAERVALEGAGFALEALSDLAKVLDG